MFESLLISVLNGYLGPYVEGLNADQLRVAVWSGNVLLEGLSLRKDALRNLHLPFDVKAGFIGKLSMQVPWSALQSQSVVIVIEDLQILAGPQHLSEYDAEAEDELQQSIKRDLLAKLDAKTSAATQTAAPTNSSLVDVILDNIKLVIRDVHVRFEDCTSYPGKAFAGGVVLSEMSSVATDANWRPRFVAEHTLVAHRLSHIEGLSVYWESDVDDHNLLMKQELVPGDLIARLRTRMTESRSNYVLDSVKTEAKVIRNKSPGAFEVPQFLLDLCVDNLPLKLLDSHFKDMVALRAHMASIRAENYRRRQRYFRLRWCRPTQRPVSPEATREERRATAVAWWHYALQALTNNKKGLLARHIMKWSRDRIAYYRLWIESLTSVELRQAKTDELEELQSQLNFEDIRLLRWRARREVERDLRLAALAATVRQERTRQEASSTWYGWMMGSGATAIDSSLELTDEQRKSLFPTHEADSEAGVGMQEELPPQYVAVQVECTLKQGYFELGSTSRDRPPLPASGTSSPLARLTFSDLHLEYQSRPGADAMSFDVLLGALSLQDLLTENTCFPVLVRHKALPADGGAPASTGPADGGGGGGGGLVSRTPKGLRTQNSFGGPGQMVFRASYETNPAGSDSARRFALSMRPSEVVVNTQLLAVVQERFRPPHLAGRRASASPEGSSSGDADDAAQALLDRIDVDLDIQAPQVLVPYDSTAPDTHVVIFDLGHLRVKKIAQGSSAARRQGLDFAAPDNPPAATTAAAAATARTVPANPPNFVEEPPSSPRSPQSDGEVGDSSRLRHSRSLSNTSDLGFVTPPSSPNDSDDDDDDGGGGSAVAPARPPSSVPASPAAATAAVTRALPRSRMASSDVPPQPLYDSFDLSVTRVQVIAGRADQGWASALRIDGATRRSRRWHVIEPFSLSWHVQRCLTPDLPSVTNLQLEGRLPKFSIHLSDSKIVALAACVTRLLAVNQPSSAAAPTLLEAPTASALESLAPEAFPGLSAAKELFKLKFQADLLTLSIDRDKRGPPVPLVELCIHGVRLETLQRPLEERLSAAVDELWVKDFSQPDMQLVSTQPAKEGSFVNLAFTRRRRRATGNGGRRAERSAAPVPTPESLTLSREEEQELAELPNRLEVNVQSLRLNVHRETIVSLLDFGAAVSTTKEKAGHAAGLGSTPGPEPAAAAEAPGGCGDAGQPPPGAPATTTAHTPPTFTCSVSVAMEQLSVNLVQKRQAVVAFDVADMSAHAVRLSSVSFVFGRLGSMTVADKTPAGAFYSSVFRTTGDEVLAFEVCRRPASELPAAADDPDWFQTRVRVRMASVRYVHTNRFLQLVAGYMATFKQMRGLISHVQTAASDLVAKSTGEQAFVKLDIAIERPLMIFPRNSLSADVIEAVLDRMTITNALKRAPEVPAHLVSGDSPPERGLVDAISVSISGMNLFTRRTVYSEQPASQFPRTRSTNLDDSDSSSSSPTEAAEAAYRATQRAPHETGNERLLEECSIDVTCERKLDPSCHYFPNFRACAKVSNVAIFASHPQYDLVMHMLGENLSQEALLLIRPEEVGDAGDASSDAGSATTGAASTPMPSRLNSPSSSGTLSPLALPSPPTSPAATREAAAAWVNLEFICDLENVTMHLFTEEEAAGAAATGAAPAAPAVPAAGEGEGGGGAGLQPVALADFDFIQSRFSYTSYTDGTPRDCGSQTEIFSKQIVARDMRPSSQGNLFSRVLRPIAAEAGSRHAPPPQLQITYRASPSDRNISIVLNKARVFVSLDWLLCVKDFALTLTPTTLIPPSLDQPLAAVPATAPPPRATKLNLSVTNPEFVLVEDVADPNTNALVLKFCSVLQYRTIPALCAFDDDPATPRLRHAASGGEMWSRLVHMALEELEVFSCRLTKEQTVAAQTALSILDPCNLEFELKSEETAAQSETQLSLDCRSRPNPKAPLYTRLSYKDLRLFLSIATQLQTSVATRQTLNLGRAEGGLSCHSLRGEVVDRLKTMGYATEDCLLALLHCNGSFESAAIWLVRTATTGPKPAAVPVSNAGILSPPNMSLHTDPFTILRVAASGSSHRAHRESLMHRLNVEMMAYAELLEKQERLNLPEESQSLRARIAASSQALTSLKEELDALDREGNAFPFGAGLVPPAGAARHAGGPAGDGAPEFVTPEAMEQLAELGFAEHDCQLALQASRGDRDQAAFWLFDNCPPILDSRLGPPASTPTAASPSPERAPPRSAAAAAGEGGAAGDRPPLERLSSLDRHLIEGGLGLPGDGEAPRDDDVIIMPSSGRSSAVSDSFNVRQTTLTAGVRATSLCLCLIDDCQGKDSPLAEFKAESPDASFRQQTRPGRATQLSVRCEAKGSIDFYNTSLSTWEPFLEPWPVLLQLQTAEAPKAGLVARLATDNRAELNINPNLLTGILSTAKAWRSDYQRMEAVTRAPFVPYQCFNESGLALELQCVVGEVSAGDAVLTIPSGGNAPFDFGVGLVKLRHLGTHRRQVHKIIVSLAGHRQLKPVVVDRVGTFVHMIVPLEGGKTSRVVLDVTVREGIKVITVRSALVVRNRLSVPLELRLDFPGRLGASSQILPPLSPAASTAIPLQWTSSVIKMRPYGWGYQWSTNGISWENFSRPAAGQRVGLGLACREIEGQSRFRPCVSVVREAMPGSQVPVPGHTLTVLPPLVIVNLLPVDLSYELVVDDDGPSGRARAVTGELASGRSEPLYNANLLKRLELAVKVAGFPKSRAVLVNPPPHDKHAAVAHTIDLVDSRHRILSLRIDNERKRGSGGARILSVFAPYWLINDSGLELKYRQANRTQLAAGLSQEARVLRSRAPFMFSCDLETLSSGNQCQVAVGDESQWSQDLAIDVVGRSGTLCVNQVPKRGRPPKMYELAVEISRGAGRFAPTKVITFVPRFVLDNQTDETLLFAQLEQRESFGQLPPLVAVPFHWTRTDLSPKLTLRLKKHPGAPEDRQWQWSQGFPIHSVGTFYINIFNAKQEVCMMRVDVNLRGAAMHILFRKAKDEPPFRIVNQSAVALMFHQEQVDRTVKVPPNAAVDYAWDDLFKPHRLKICATKAPYKFAQTYDLQRIHEPPGLMYPQFFYLVGPSGLVVGLPPGCTEREAPSVRASLALRQTSDPFQLWQITKTGQLKNRAGYRLEWDGKFVLLKRPRGTLGGQRAEEQAPSTQWKLESGRVLSRSAGGRPSRALQAMFDHESRVASPGDLLTLGPIQRRLSVTQKFTLSKTPPGSGHLTARILAKGPTRVLVVADSSLTGRLDDRGWVHIPTDAGPKPLPSLADKTLDASGQNPGKGALGRLLGGPLAIKVVLPGGVGVSVIDSTPTELLYFSSRGIDLGLRQMAGSRSVDLTIKHLQIDNQLEQLSRFPVCLSPEPLVKNTLPIPSVCLRATLAHGDGNDATVFREFELNIRPHSLHVEERCLLKLLRFSRLEGHGPALAAPLPDGCDEAWNDQGRAELDETLSPAGREDSAAAGSSIYFEILKLNAVELRVSLLVAADLEPELEETKQSISGLGLLVGFEDAIMSLEAFVLKQPYASRAQLVDLVLQHYKQEVLRQGYKILGAVDFLGNPIGMLQTMGSGLQDLYAKSSTGDVLGGSKSFAQKVTVGLSDSASKLTGSISRSLGRATMDADYQRARERNKGAAKDSAGHLKSGFASLTRGLFSGVAGVVTQPVKGAREEGVDGLVTGVVRGLVGLVTKPVSGVFDLASEATAAVRVSAASSSFSPSRARLPRAFGPDRAVQVFSSDDASGRDQLLELNRMNTEELFVARDDIQSLKLVALTTSERIILLDTDHLNGAGTKVNSEIWFSGLYRTSVRRDAKLVYLQLHVNSKMIQRITEALEMDQSQAVRLTPPTWSDEDVGRPCLIRCDSEAIAKRVHEHIQFALNFYSERKHLAQARAADSDSGRPA